MPWKQNTFTLPDFFAAAMRRDGAGRHDSDHTWIQTGSLETGDRWCENEPDTEKFNFISSKTINIQWVSTRFMLKLQRNSYGWLHFQPKHGKHIHQNECHYITSAVFRPPITEPSKCRRGPRTLVTWLTKVLIRRRILHIIQHLLGQMFQLILRPEGRSAWCRSRAWIPTLKKKKNSLWCDIKALRQ